MMTVEERHNMRPLLDLHKGAMKIKYGVINAQFVVSDGKIFEVVGNVNQNVNIERGNNSRGAQLILEEIKFLFENKQTGLVTFVVKMDTGDITKVSIQRQLKNSYEREMPLASAE